eukprot:scaffold315492_cov46-Attheya_sp.AAC.3
MFDLTINKISDLRHANEAKYYEEHPDKQLIAMNLAPSVNSPNQDVDIKITPDARDIAENLATLMGVDPLDQGNKSLHGGTQKSSTAIEAQRGWDAAITLLMLEGARIVTNTHTGAAKVAYPTITEDWTELYSNAHVAQLSPALNSLLKAACKDRDASIHDLDKAINMPEFSQLAAKSFTQVITKRMSLDDNTSFKRNEISILTLLRAPEHNAEYNNYVMAKYTTEVDHMVNQTEKQQSKVSTENFSGRIQEEPDDVVTAIANHDVIYQCKFGFDPNNEESIPLLSKYMRQLGDLWCSRAFRTWFHKVKHSAPWITHTLLTQLYILISKTAMIATTPPTNDFLSGAKSCPPSFIWMWQKPSSISRETLSQPSRRPP